MARVTRDILISAGMPIWDINRFVNEWPKGAEITPANMERAQKIGLRTSVFVAALGTQGEFDAFTCPDKDTLWRAETAERERHKAAMENILEDHKKTIFRKRAEILTGIMRRIEEDYSGMPPE